MLVRGDPAFPHALPLLVSGQCNSGVVVDIIYTYSPTASHREGVVKSYCLILGGDVFYRYSGSVTAVLRLHGGVWGLLAQRQQLLPIVL